MDTLATVAFARHLIDIDSTTGREQAAGEWLASALRDLGYDVVRQPVADGRFNVFARIDQPSVVLSTHFDCVPPFFPSDVRDGALFGRGSCDAKGILACQVGAAERMRAAGERRVGLLFVVGEERGSEGAAIANARAPGSKFLINGEPTDNRLGVATRGILRLRLTARGRAAHSAAPEEGESAIDTLLDALVRMRTLRWPSDPQLGATFYTLGLIEGGIAPNVISPSASAEAMFRIVGSPDEVLNTARQLEPAVRVEEVLRVPMVRLHTIEGLPSAVFPFTTDIPLLNRWGTPLLFGPGSFLVAHTDREHVRIDEMERAVDVYQQLAASCLSSPLCASV
ncbi:MAG TPA: M20/M25/M40 family metallo-hydrolase [Vicinamibacterales bacterium]|nr:M20/M25/M40 family metallo-hydrolase [Vicinamibacterales bacterium]